MVVDTVDANSQAHDCIQVRSLGVAFWVVILYDDCVCWQPMGWTSEMVAQTYNISRQKQDEYALISHTRAAKVSLPFPLSETLIEGFI